MYLIALVTRLSSISRIRCRSTASGTGVVGHALVHRDRPPPLAQHPRGLGHVADQLPQVAFLHRQRRPALVGPRQREQALHHLRHLVDLRQRLVERLEDLRAARPGCISARSTPARSTMSGVLSSWLASAVKRCRLAKLCSSRASMPFTVSASRAISSPDSGTASRRWRLRAVGDGLDLVHDALHRPERRPGQPVAHQGGRGQDHRRDEQHGAKQLGGPERDLLGRRGDQEPADLGPARLDPHRPGSARCPPAGRRARIVPARLGSRRVSSGAVRRSRSSARERARRLREREDVAARCR